MALENELYFLVSQCKILSVTTDIKSLCVTKGFLVVLLREKMVVSSFVLAIRCVLNFLMLHATNGVGAHFSKLRLLGRPLKNGLGRSPKKGNRQRKSAKKSPQERGPG
jgi:hypothetical protein